MEEFPSWEIALNNLESGKIRVATPPSSPEGLWEVNSEIKASILQAFKEGKIMRYKGYVDKHSLLPQEFTPDRGVRIVPFGTTVRRGAYIAPGVIIMPPSYINVGAYIDSGTMVDSHVLVGSCAQIGKNVHLSAGVQIGGVLEPIGAHPVIIEDDAFIGADAIIVEGIIVKRRAIIAAGVVLSSGVPVYDTVHKRKLDKGEPIPAGAVVVSGTRPFSANDWAQKEGLQLACALIIKYRDDHSDAKTELESLLR
jgi:2,3,4,5-tetrahydropyridine-2,6-dicarboxylate N-succinyltransferase